jgi:shikimate kinase
MTQPVANQEPVILIGPMKAGKTTVGTLLAAQLECSFTSLDRLERRYAEALGFDALLADSIQAAQGDWAWYTYRRQFFAEVVVRFLADHASGVLELGGGHPILADEAQQARVDRTLAPFRHVVLLLPTPDIDASLGILKGRQKPAYRDDDWNEKFLQDDRYFRLAKQVIYTEGQSPEATCDEILARIESNRHRPSYHHGAHL